MSPADEQDVLVELMRLRSEMLTALQGLTQAVAANTTATQKLAAQSDATLRILVWALVGSQLGAETLRVMAEWFLKVGAAG